VYQANLSGSFSLFIEKENDIIAWSTGNCSDTSITVGIDSYNLPMNLITFTSIFFISLLIDSIRHERIFLDDGEHLEKASEMRIQSLVTPDKIRDKPSLFWG